MENGDGLCIPKLNGKTSKWNNFYFIEMDMADFYNKHKGYDIPVNGIENNEVVRMKWFTLTELKTLEHDPQQITKMLTFGKIHPPIIGIIRDHSNKIKSSIIPTLMPLPITQNEELIQLIRSIDQIHNNKKHINKLVKLTK